MQHPSGAAGSCSRSLPACPSSVCPACCGTCGWVCCGAWHHSLVPVPRQATRQPQGTRLFVASLLPRENDHCRRGAGGREGRHGAFGAAQLEGGFGRGLGTAESGTDLEGSALAQYLEGHGVCANNHYILLWMSLLWFWRGRRGGRTNKYLHYSKEKKKKVLHTTAHNYTQLRV